MNIQVGINPIGISSDGTNVWVANSGGGNVSQISISSGTVVKTITVGNNPSGISSDGTNVWVTNSGDGNVSQISILSGTVVNTITVGDTLLGISSDGTNVWVVGQNTNSVYQISISSGTVVKTIAVGSSPSSISSDGTNVWVTNNLSNTVSQISISSGTVVKTITVGNNPSGISSYGTNVWVSNTDDNTVSKIIISQSPPCFFYNSKILTNKGYRPIQDLRKGDLVKTLKHYYKPIYMIGKKDMNHPASQERIKNQLYKCSKHQYPELNEDLIITGCHAILENCFYSEKQREKVIEINGDTFMTDGKLRLPACADDRTTVYEIPGEYTVYHLALENENYFTNYGIYANGLLVETISKYDLKEYGKMELIE
jgi:outer membrane lipoprotein-sorting protein